MSEYAVYSKMYFANIITENQFGYHKDALWYGGDVKNFCTMIMDEMNSWYLPNKMKLSPEIIKFYDKIEACAKEDAKPKDLLSFEKMKGEMFKANGLRMELKVTNNLVDMYDFIAGEIFTIYAKNGEKLEDYKNLIELLEYLKEKYEIAPQLLAAVENPTEQTIAEALYAIDIKFNYTLRHYVPGSKE